MQVVRLHQEFGLTGIWGFIYKNPIMISLSEPVVVAAILFLTPGVLCMYKAHRDLA